ncbi:hypothetical protein DERF_006597 [Dermatophagoides farinae]|uniref:Uncharacterized protein n=1 Tax=Dermatophagoides farinae TaxID=6954 RepID=A0A922HZC1_DERFA|nr:hypothetical protein DERF_006597 [Dermatophagoides farinae]
MINDDDDDDDDDGHILIVNSVLYWERKKNTEMNLMVCLTCNKQMKTKTNELYSQCNLRKCEWYNKKK